MTSHFAVVGDVHGHMNQMVHDLQLWEQCNDVRLEFVLQVGDFEPVRHAADLATVHVPAKYRKLGDFGDFAEGYESFPWPVSFIGGNHEPYGYLEQNPAGFTLVDNCHYLGRVGHGTMGGLQVAWLSGIHHPSHFNSPRPPIDRINDERVSTPHAGSVSPQRYTYFNKDDMARLRNVPQPDVLLLHDWPAGMQASSTFTRRWGGKDSEGLVSTGNSEAGDLVRRCQPAWVFCGHMHESFCGEMVSGNVLSQVICLSNVGSAGSFAIMGRGAHGLQLVAFDNFVGND